MKARSKFFLVFPMAFFLICSIGISGASESTTKMIETYRFSLGNSSCLSMECNLATVFFLIPSDKTSQDIHMTIQPVCVGNYTGNETMELDIYCVDGFTDTYDMMPSLDPCNSANNYEKDFVVNSTGYSVFGERKFQQFWCGFRRNPSSTDPFIAEIDVTVDGVGLFSNYPDATTVEQMDSQSSMAVSLQSFSNFNLNIWRIGYNIFVIGAIFFGIFIVVGAVPNAIKWVIRKVTED